MKQNGVAGAYLLQDLQCCLGSNYENVQNRTNREPTPIETYRKAAKAVLSTSSSLRRASAKYSVNFVTLQTLCKELDRGNVRDTFIEFYSNLAKVYDKHIFQCQYIYSVDETAVTTG